VRAGDVAAPAYYVVHTDGASRGNPGHAALGVVIADPDGNALVEWNDYIGQATNNVAEYRALLAAIERLLELPLAPARFHLDSELIVKQLNGQYRVKDEKMKLLYEQVRVKLTRIPGATFTHVAREKNARADALANEAIDRALAGAKG
jgi:ribonuclease HI